MTPKKRRKQRKSSISQSIMCEAANTGYLNGIAYTKSREQYQRNIKKFITFCRKYYDSKSLEDTSKHIQDYVDWLVKEQYSASTIHTYLACVCGLFKINMKNIQKPIRTTAFFTKGRKYSNNPTSKQDISNPKWKDIIDFASRVGIRRAELFALTGDCFRYNTNNESFVVVKCGKGKKKHLQKLIPGDVEIIKHYFDGKNADEKIFPFEKYRSCQVNFHHFRREYAKRFYAYYADFAKIPENRKKMLTEIKARWQTNTYPNGKVKPLPPSKIEGYYYLRGETRKKAKDLGLPVKYDKLVLLYTSLFALSHWRNGVTIQSYLITE